MLAIKKKVKQIVGCKPEDIDESILLSNEPIVLKGLVKDWPVVIAAQSTPLGASNYIRQFYQNATVGSFYAEPEEKGRFFYNQDLTGFNFEFRKLKLDQFLDTIQDYKNEPSSPGLYVGSTTVDTCLPGFRNSNDLPLSQLHPLMTIWLGNKSRIAAHYDLPDNLACCIAGRRRFSLFPPEELENLYVGPLDFTPAGQAISLVDFKDPDYTKHPKFKQALASGLVAELEPGDALLIPSMWWHHVEALENFNVLVNYWWRQSPAYMGPPSNALNHAILAIRDLPESQRKAWKKLFEHYVFESSEQSYEHIETRALGVLGPMTDITGRRLRANLLAQLNR